MRNFERRYGQWVVEKRWWILLFSLLFVAVAVYGASLLTFQNNNRVFFSEDNPQLKAFEAMERTYAKNENVMLVITAKQGDIFQPEVLAAIQELTERSWQVPYSSRVDSLTNYQYSYAEEDDLIVEDLISAPGELEADELQRIRQIALQEPALLHRIISKDGTVSAIVIDVQKPENDTEATPKIVKFVEQMAEQFREDYPDITVRLGGGEMFAQAFMEVSMEDMRTLVPLMYLALVVVMYLLLRSLLATVCTFVVIGFSMATTMGLAGWLGIVISPPSVNAPTIVLTLAMAHCIHILSGLLLQMRQASEQHVAIIESLRVNLQPVILTSVTTTIGFLCMNFSDAPPFRDLGNIVAIGSVMAMLFALTTLPALVAVLPLKVKPQLSQQSTMTPMDKLGDYVVKNTRWLTLATLALAVVTIPGIAKIQLDDSFITYFDERYDIRQVSEFTQDRLGGLDMLEYSLNSGEANGINDPAYLNKVEAFANWFRAQPKVTHVAVITNTIKRLNQNMHADDAEYYRIPDDKNLAAQYLLLYEMSLPYGLDLNNQVNVDKSATRMIVTVNRASSAELRTLDESALAWLDAHAPVSMQTHGAGMSLMFAHISERNITQMLGGTMLALALISAILIVTLRSIRVGVTSLVPNLLPAAMAFGVWGYFVGEVGLSVAIVGSLTLGIIVDDTVHFLSKYQRARNEHQLSSADAVRYAFSTVGKALFTTTVILVAGFSMLAFSGFKLNADTGMLTAIVISLALITDFFLLPGLLMKLDKRKVPTATA